jgi:hypothetical protein
MRWFQSLQLAWRRVTLSLKIYESHYGDRIVHGMPAFFLLAFCGMLLGILRKGALRAHHFSWLAMFAALWFGVMLTGVINPRYRYIFEPYCVLYALLALDVLIGMFSFTSSRGAGEIPVPVGSGAA